MKEILVNILNDKIMCINFPSLLLSSEEIVKTACYETLSKIKQIIEDENLYDVECYDKIQVIINAFKDIGSDCGRHELF